MPLLFAGVAVDSCEITLSGQILRSRDRGVLPVIASLLWPGGSVELEPEVREWLEKLSADSFARAAFYIDLLAAEGPLVGEPYTRQIDGKLRELRFYLGDLTMRISYWIASDRRIILLTVFHKTRMRKIEKRTGRGGRCLAARARRTRWTRSGDDRADRLG
ncbi:type II toxin-antitoxin system RelE/ParE family toxin [Nonomuraea sp. JJY05]|uniref:type II toxin-antitoxin system RelE/ParE family toxin n=1 Tax=Nonomuraea sp. JJY05 TaxID=3350255 RepID=UPI00373E7C85